MLDTPYEFNKVNIDSFSVDPITKINYHFIAKARKYFVTFEFFSFDIIAVKFRDNKDKGSRGAYSKIFNDHDAFRVIGTCIHIMAQVWKEHPSASFAFHAIPRIDTNPKTKRKHTKKSEEEYLRSRYNIYTYGMVNYFPAEKFKHIRDRNNSLYVLLNQKNGNAQLCLDKLSQYLIANTDVVFDPEM